jgi:hypothetical protein
LSRGRRVARRRGDGRRVRRPNPLALRRHASFGTSKLEEVTNPRLFTTRYARSRPQLRLFGLEDALGEGGWLKALRLEEYATRTRRRHMAVQQALFPYLEAL